MPPAPLVAPGITFGDAAEMDPVPAHVPQLDERSGGSTKSPELVDRDATSHAHILVDRLFARQKHIEKSDMIVDIVVPRIGYVQHQKRSRNAGTL